MALNQKLQHEVLFVIFAFSIDHFHDLVQILPALHREDAKVRAVRRIVFSKPDGKVRKTRRDRLGKNTNPIESILSRRV